MAILARAMTTAVRLVGGGTGRGGAVARGLASALVARGVAMAAGLLVVPLTVGYLGAERYGFWMTLSSTLGWLSLADLGLANGLTNSLSQAFGLDDRARARSVVATTMWALAGIAAALALALLSAWPFIDWASVFNLGAGVAGGEVRVAVAVAAACALAAFPLGVLDRVYAAYQEPHLANAWSTLASLAGLAAVFGVTRGRGGLVPLVAALAGAPLLVALANGLWFFGRRRPELRPAWSAVSRAQLRAASGNAARFFVIQIIGLLLFSTDNVVITRVLGAAPVTPYSVAWKLFTIPTLYVTLLGPYLWPAYAEAQVRGDVRWIRRAAARSVASSAVVAGALGVPLAVFGQRLCLLWAGPAAVPPQAVLWWLAAWVILSAPATAVACLLNGLGQLRGQMLYGVVAAAANLWLSIAWARRHGLAGVIAGTVVSYLVFAAAPAALEALRAVRRLGPPAEGSRG